MEHSISVPVEGLKHNSDIFADYLCGFFNEILRCCKFTSLLKRASVTPVFKKSYPDSTSAFKKRYPVSKENYRPVSILPVMSKIFEKLLCKQFTVLAGQNLSKYKCGFKKGFSAQYSLVAMLEKMKRGSGQ